MTALPQWTIGLMNADTFAKYGEFTQYSGASYTKRLNNAGSCAVSLSLDDPISTYVQPLSTAIYFERNGRMVWSGPIIIREDSLPDRRVTIQAVGYFDRLLKRMFREFTTSFVGSDAGAIAQALVAIANEQRDTKIIVKSVEPTQTRDRTYRRFASIGEAIVELSQVENGFDFEVVNNEMTIASKLGYNRGLNSIVSPCVFAYQTAQNNIASFTRRDDASSLVNRFNAICSSSIEVVADEGSINSYNLIEATQDLGQVNSNIARAYAAAEIAVRGLPIETYDVSLVSVDEDNRCPRFDGNVLDDVHFFGLGDTVRLLIEDTKLPAVDVDLRVFAATLSLDANGNEKTTSIQLAGPVRTTFSTLGFPDAGSYYSATRAGNSVTSTTYTSGNASFESIPIGNASLGVLPWVIGQSILGSDTVLS